MSAAEAQVSTSRTASLCAKQTHRPHEPEDASCALVTGQTSHVVGQVRGEAAPLIGKVVTRASAHGGDGNEFGCTGKSHSACAPRDRCDRCDALEEGDVLLILPKQQMHETLPVQKTTPSPPQDDDGSRARFLSTYTDPQMAIYQGGGYVIMVVPIDATRRGSERGGGRAPTRRSEIVVVDDDDDENGHCDGTSRPVDRTDGNTAAGDWTRHQAKQPCHHVRPSSGSSCSSCSYAAAAAARRQTFSDKAHAQGKRPPRERRALTDIRHQRDGTAMLPIDARDTSGRARLFPEAKENGSDAMHRSASPPLVRYAVVRRSLSFLDRHNQSVMAERWFRTRSAYPAFMRVRRALESVGIEWHAPCHYTYAQASQGFVLWASMGRFSFIDPRFTNDGCAPAARADESREVGALPVGKQTRPRFRYLDDYDGSRFPFSEAAPAPCSPAFSNSTASGGNRRIRSQTGSLANPSGCASHCLSSYVNTLAGGLVGLYIGGPVGGAIGGATGMLLDSRSNGSQTRARF